MVVTDDMVYHACEAVLEGVFRPAVPYTPQDIYRNGKLVRRRSTGNMRRNATKIRRLSQQTTEIFVDAGHEGEGDGIAPYVVYTNDPWLSPKWNGKKNPNQGWFERATEAVAIELAAMLGGTLERKGVDNDRHLSFNRTAGE